MDQACTISKFKQRKAQMRVRGTHHELRMHLQTLYGLLYSSEGDDDDQTYFCYDGNVYCLGVGTLLPRFLSAVETTCKGNVFLIAGATGAENDGVDPVVLTTQCEHGRLIPSSRESDISLQFSWAFRWAFVKCKRWRIASQYDIESEELD